MNDDAPTVAPTPPPPPPTPPPVPVMEYNTPRADQVPRRKYLGALVLASVLGAILLALLLYHVATRAAPAAVVVKPAPVLVTRSAVQPNFKAQMAESRRRSNESRLNDLLTRTLPPSQVVYEEDPVAARQLFGKGICNAQASRRQMSQPWWGAFEPPVFQTDGFRQEGQSDQRDALLFAHQLTSPAGNRRLVLLEMEVKLDGTKLSNDEYKVAINRQLKYRVCEPKLSGSTPDVVRYGQSLKIVQDGERNIIPIKWVDGSLRSARPTEYNLRFFAGQPDAQDPSHFTVAYEISGVKNVIDGWLTDDDFLRIVPRGGRVEKGNWQIDAVK